MSRQVLVIEDDEDIANLVKLQLTELSCQVKLAFDGAVGLAEAQSGHYDLVILDLMLPGMDGLEICRRIRGQGRYVPILMLTSKSSEIDRVLGLEMGADDYVTKPFSVIELAARVKAIFRRVDNLSKGQDDAKAVIRAGGLSIDICRRSVELNGKPWISPPRNSTCWCISRATQDACSPAPSCWTACGATRTAGINTRSIPTSTVCAPSSKRRRTNRL